MAWIVLEHPDFPWERQDLPAPVLAKLAEAILTLKASRHANMKELRFTARGVWRVAFAFDEARHAVVLVAGNKQGKDQRRFYENLVAVADDRFDDWLDAKG
jgi:hypothetical protein